MTVGALNNGFSESTQLDCSSGLQVGNRLVQELRVRRLRLHQLRQGARALLRHLLLPGRALHFWQKYGSDPANVKAKDPLVAMAKEFGFGTTTGGDVTGEASGRIADRKWKLAYWKAMKGYYCKVDRKNTTGQRDFLHVFAHEFCLEGFNYRAGDAVNFVDRPGRHDGHAAPARPRLRRALQRRQAAASRGWPRRWSAPTAS